MLQIENPTGLAATAFLAADPDGVDTVYAIVKGTFALDPRQDDPAVEPPLAPVQAPVAARATHHGDPAASSIRLPSDVGLVKPGTDVLLTGHAHAPDGRPTTEHTVTLAVGAVRQTVRVTGDRTWTRQAGGGWAPSDAAPWVRLPLVWERAYGGRCVVAGQVREAPHNPVGAGFWTPDVGSPEGRALPNLEDPDAPLTEPGAAVPARCFAPVAEHWAPRRDHAGTYDARWQRERAPYLPVDFDPRFFQLAPPGLVAPGWLSGGEPVHVLGATPGGALRFAVPRLAVAVTYVVDGAAHPVPARLDTLLVQPDLRRVLVTWRAALACDKRALRVETLRVAAERATAARVASERGA